MSGNDTTARQTRRKMLKAVGATGLALGAAGSAAANGGDARRPAAKTSEAAPEGEWEYKCDKDLPCCSGTGCQQYKRYCANDDCSGWEKSGCCSGDCAPLSC